MFKARGSSKPATSILPIGTFRLQATGRNGSSHAELHMHILVDHAWYNYLPPELAVSTSSLDLFSRQQDRLSLHGEIKWGRGDCRPSFAWFFVLLASFIPRLADAGPISLQSRDIGDFSSQRVAHYLPCLRSSGSIFCCPKSCQGFVWYTTHVCKQHQ